MEYQHGVAYPHRRRTSRSATPPLRQGRRAQPPAEVQASWPVSALSSCILVVLSPFRTLPLSGDRKQNAQLAVTRLGEARGDLYRELIDEQERHAAFDVVKQLLQARLVDVTAYDDGEESGLGSRTLQIDLRRQHVAAKPGHRRGDVLQQRRAGDRHGRAFQEWRTGPTSDAGNLTAGGAGAAALELFQHGGGCRDIGALAQYVSQR